MYACTLQLDSAECTIACGTMKKSLASLHRDFYWESQDDGISWFDADYKKFMTQLFCETSWKVRRCRLIVSHLFQRISKVNCKSDHWPSTTCKDFKGGEELEKMGGSRLPFGRLAVQCDAADLWGRCSRYGAGAMVPCSRCGRQPLRMLSITMTRKPWNYETMKLRNIMFNVCPKSELHVADFLLWVYDQAMSLSASNFHVKPLNAWRCEAEWRCGSLGTATTPVQSRTCTTERATWKHSIPTYSNLHLGNKRGTRVEQGLTRPVSVEG